MLPLPLVLFVDLSSFQSVLEKLDVFILIFEFSLLVSDGDSTDLIFNFVPHQLCFIMLHLIQWVVRAKYFECRCYALPFLLNSLERRLDCTDDWNALIRNQHSLVERDCILGVGVVLFPANE